MKISKNQLKQLIKEELRNILSEEEQEDDAAEAARAKKTQEEDRHAANRLGMPCTNTGFGPPGSPKWMNCMEQVLGSVLSVVGPNA